MKTLYCCFLTLSGLLLIACDENPSVVAAPTDSQGVDRRMSQMENRLNAIEQMVRTLDQRDDRLADMAASNASSRPRSPRPAVNSTTNNDDLRALNDDINRINRRLDSVSEQLTAIVEGLQQMGEDNSELRSTLADHERALERILSGN